MKKLVLAVLFSGAAFTAYANTAKPDVKKLEANFEALDIDHDGTVTQTEADKNDKFKTAYKKADKDGDGTVSKTEYMEFEGVKVK